MNEYMYVMLSKVCTYCINIIQDSTLNTEL